MLLHAQLCFAILERAGAINLVQALEMIQTFIYLFIYFLQGWQSIFMRNPFRVFMEG